MRPGSAPVRCGAVLVALAAAAAAQQAVSPGLVEQLEAFELERGRFRRLLPGDDGVTAEMSRSYWLAFERASADWVRRWPNGEFAWRARLEALAGVERADPGAVLEAVDGAERTAGRAPSLHFPENLQFLAARALLRHGLEPARARRRAAGGPAAELHKLERLRQIRGGDPAGEPRAARQAGDDSCAAGGGCGRSGQGCAGLARSARRSGSRCAAGQRADRDAALAYAAARLVLHTRRARLARMLGHFETAIAEYREAVGSGRPSAAAASRLAIWPC